MQGLDFVGVIFGEIIVIISNVLYLYFVDL